MADDKSQKWRIDLDIKQFVANATTAQASVQKIGDATNLKGLTEGLLRAGTAVGVVGTAVAAFKAGLSFVKEYENVQAINEQFAMLARNAGLAGDNLKEKVLAAAKGLADQEDTIIAASEAMTKLGVNASQLPEIMDLARKRTLVFGGDLISNFDQISSAIAAGNTRALRNIGIVVDQEKALSAYARTVGQTVDTLSAEQRQRAMLDASLKKARETYKGLNEDTRAVTIGWEKLIVTLKDLGETVMEVFGKKIQPWFKKFVGGAQSMAEAGTKWIKENFGSEADQATGKLENVYKQLNALRMRVNEAKVAKGEGGFLNFLIYGAGGPDLEIKNLEKKIEKLEKMRDELMAKSQPKAEAVAAPEAAPTRAAGPSVDYEAIKAQRSKFEADLLAMRQQRLAAEREQAEASINSQGQLEIDGERILMAQKLTLWEEYQARVAQIESSKAMSDAQKEEMLMEQERIYVAQRIQMEQELDQVRQQSLDNWVNNSQSATEGVSRAFIAGAAQQKRALTDWGATGKLVYNSFANNATQALLAFGSGAMNAQEALRALTFGVIADTAEAKGKEMLLASIWPPNPAGMAGGAGLIALAGFLRSKAGAAAGGGIPGVGGGAGTTPTMPEGDRPEMKETEKKVVSIQVQGSYFETEQTQRRLVEMIRAESDATDFRFRQIGG